MMDAAALGAVLRSAEHDLFRLETLDFYEPDREGYERWLAGDGLDEAALAPWLERLAAEKARGLSRRRVHVLRSPLTPYLRYECEVYARNAQAGEDVRILDTAERDVPESLRRVAGQDFWVVDSQHVVAMGYTPAGQFRGAFMLDPPHLHIRAANAAWGAAEPLETWWARHRSDRKAA